jgi:2,3-dihydroxy-p-cumate/2,3-dihydroxybenzoate 3,4-dioxygenase
MQGDHPLGCTGLARVELVVSDLERSARFYEDVVGLMPLDDGALVRSFAAGDDGGRLLLRQGERVGCSLAVWRVAEDQDLDRLTIRLAGAGMAFDETTGQDGARAVCVVESFTGAALAFEGPARGIETKPFQATHTRIQRLGHVVCASPQADAAVAWMVERLDFKVSDWIDGGTTFLRPALSPFHHGLGIARAPANRLHHLNFMVSEIDDIGRASHRLARAGVRIVFGPGRHPTSGSVFLYFLDPDGLTLEYSFGMETFPVQCARDPRAWPALPASVDLWGSPRSADLGRIGALLGELPHNSPT